MTDKERLKDIKAVVENKNGIVERISHQDINWLIKQAERVQELEETVEDYKTVNKELHQRGRKIRKQNKRYKQALEFYADENNNHNKIDLTIREYELMSPVVKDSGKIARKALEGEE